MRGKKKYSVAFRKEAVDQVLQDKLSVFKVGQELGIDKTLIRKWILIYQTHGINGLMPSSIIHYPSEFKIRVIRAM
jgi:transposase